MDLHNLSNKPVHTIVAIAAGVIGASLVLFFFLGKLVPAAAIVGGTGFALVLRYSNNPRSLMLWCLILTLPLDLSKRFLLRPHMGGSSAVAIELPDFFLIGLLFFLVRDFFRGRRVWYIPIPVWTWSVLIGVGCISMALGPFRVLAFLEVFQKCKLLLLLLVLCNEVCRRERLEHLIGAMLSSVCLQSLIGIAQYVRGQPLGLQMFGEVSQGVVDLLSIGTLESGAFVFRISALLGHANFFAAFVACHLPLALALLFAPCKIWLRALALPCLAFGSVALVLTLSRTGWVIAAFCLSWVMLASFIHPEMRSRFVFGRVVIVAGAIVMGIAFSGPIMTRIMKSDRGATDVRFELLEVAWRMFKDYPVIGSGLNTFVYNMRPYTVYRTRGDFELNLGKATPVVHNVYAIYLVEVGIIGLAALLLVSGSIILMGLSNLRSKDGFLFAVGLGGLLGFVGFLLDWLTSFSLRHAPMSREIFLIIALGCIARYFIRGASDPYTAKKMEKLEGSRESEKSLVEVVSTSLP